MRTNNIEEAFTKSLTTEVTNISSNLVEVGIDSALESGIIKDIPVINVLVSLYKTGVSIRERRYIKNIIKFLSEFDKINKDQKNKFLYENLKTDTDREKFGETVLYLIEKSDDIQKPELYARAFELHITNECTYNDAVRVCKIIDKSFVEDLKEIFNIKSGEPNNSHIASELYKNGLLSFGGMVASSIVESDDEDNGGMIYTINKYGEIIKRIIKNT